MKDCFWGFIYLRSCQINLWGPAIAAHRNKVYPPAYIQCTGNYNTVTPNVSYDFDTNQGHITFAFPVNLRSRLFDSKYRYIRVSTLVTFMFKSCETSAYRHGQPNTDSHSTMRVQIRLPISVHFSVCIHLGTNAFALKPEQSKSLNGGTGGNRSVPEHLP